MLMSANNRDQKRCPIFTVNLPNNIKYANKFDLENMQKILAFKSSLQVSLIIKCFLFCLR